MKIVPNAFGEKPVLKLMFGALIRAAESWRGLRFTEFELRQLDAVRKDLDAEYEASITRSDRPSQPRFFQQIRALTAALDPTYAFKQHAFYGTILSIHSKGAR